jgi:hypothetical protein
MLVSEAVPTDQDGVRFMYMPHHCCIEALEWLDQNLIEFEPTRN